MAADVRSPDDMKSAAESVRERFGGVHGLVSAAGAPVGGTMDALTKEAADETFAVKLDGERNFRNAFSVFEPEFTVLCSSISSVVGPPGQADYCAANSVLDARAYAAGGRIVSLDLDTWEEAGLAHRFAASKGGLPESPPFSRRFPEKNGEIIFETDLSDSDWLVREHRYGGRGLVAGATYAELALLAFARLTGEARAVMTDIAFLSPLFVGPESPQTLRIVLQREGEGFSFVAKSGTMHATGRIAPLAGTNAPPDAKKGEPGRGELDFRKEKGRILKGTPLELEGRWDSLRTVRFGEREALGSLELSDEFREDLKRHILHPALLDLALGCGRIALFEGFHLPVACKSLRVFRPLPSRFLSRSVFSGGTDDLPTCDLTLTDEAGETLALVEGFVAKRVRDMGLPASHSGGKRSAGTSGWTLLSGEGIRPSEGGRIFEAALSAGAPRLVVSTRDLRVLEEGPRRRPKASKDATPPRNELERELSAVWGELLGVEKVGVHDNFYELGGDSLLILQAIPKSRKRGIALDPSLVLSNPTVASLASDVDEDDLAQALSEVEFD